MLVLMHQHGGTVDTTPLVTVPINAVPDRAYICVMSYVMFGFIYPLG
jgi:hypothetical protein